MADRDKINSSQKVEVRMRDPEGLPSKPKSVPLSEAIAMSDWTDDPGVGKAVLLEDGSELLNPVPMAPPVGYVDGPSIMDMIQRQVEKHLATLKPDDEIDLEEELNDFGEDDEIDPTSLYEVVSMELDAPPLPPAPVPEPPASADPPDVPLPPAPVPVDPA